MMEMKRRRNDPDSKETNQKKQVKKLHIPQEWRENWRRESVIPSPVKTNDTRGEISEPTSNHFTRLTALDFFE